MSFWAAAFGALGSAFTSRSAKKENQKQMDALRRLEEMKAANDRRMAEWERGNVLQDRAYRAESFGNYAQFNKTPGIQSPGPIDTTVTPVGLPQGVAPNARPTNGNQGLMFFT